jgi:hypothetical protein
MPGRPVPKPRDEARTRELRGLAERFWNLYRDQPRKRCVHASAELFIYLADRGFHCAAVRRHIHRRGELFEHSWVEVELGDLTYVLDVTGPQQFGLEGAMHTKAEYLSKMLAHGGA